MVNKKLPSTRNRKLPDVLITVNCIKNLLCDVRFPFLYLHSLESVFRSATLANDVPCRVRHRPAENEKNFKSRVQAAVYQELFVFHLFET